MKHALLKSAVATGIGLGVLASGAFAQSTTSVLNEVNQTQNASGIYQRMDIGSVVTPGGAGGVAAHARTESRGSINQTQNAVGGRQELYMGTIVSTAGGNAQSRVRVDNLNQVQNGVGNLQRMAVGTVGINPVTGAFSARATGNTNVFVDTINQRQGGAVVGRPQYLSIGSVW